MRIAVTGARGFIGRNLQVRLRELGHEDVVPIAHDVAADALDAMLVGVDFVFHLAGVNRPQDPAEFATGNAGFTEQLVAAMSRQARPPRVAYSSSAHATLDNAYGRSKRQAEQAVQHYAERTGVSAHVFRFTNVFGKWSRPNYNSAVATFCHNIARGQPITINDPHAPLRLIYVDDVVEQLCALLDQTDAASGLMSSGPEYEISVGALAEQIRAFEASRTSLVSERVGSGLTRALYATYLSFLPPSAFEYEVARHADPRGVFVEMLKTPDCGQIG